MNKTDLVLQVAKRTGLDKRDVGRAVNELLDVVRDTVAKGQRVTLADFGTFQRQRRKARVGRNPRTGETVPIPATTRPAFTPGRGFRTAVEERARRGRKKKTGAKRPRR